MICTYEKYSIFSGRVIIILLFQFLLLLYAVKSPEAAEQGPLIIPGTPGSFAQLVKKSKNSVVNISTIKIVKSEIPNYTFRSPFGQNDPFQEFFDRFFKEQVPREFRQKSLGSGFIIDKGGYILTNNHVVEKTDEIKVTLSNKKDFDARIIGRDPKTDLALIKIETDEALAPLMLGDSDQLEVGEWVIAIGNPFSLDHTVTAGIVSAKYRKIGPGYYSNFIQTDASINPGNSGGPLLNTKGEVVGINSAIYSGTGGSIGIGFAIPINMAKDLLPQLQEGKVVRGWLGVIIQSVTNELKEKLGLSSVEGALVADVTPGGPAADAGIERGDVIISFDGKQISEMDDLPFIVGATRVGKRIKVEVIREGKSKFIDVEIGELKEEKDFDEDIEKGENLGMTIEEISPEMVQQYRLPVSDGLIIMKVEETSPAGEAGLREGDIILEIDQEPVKDLAKYRKIIQKYSKGDTILFLIKREGTTLYETLKIW